jgi:hypothetical protein
VQCPTSRRARSPHEDNQLASFGWYQVRH